MTDSLGVDCAFRHRVQLDSRSSSIVRGVRAAHCRRIATLANRATSIGDSARASNYNPSTRGSLQRSSLRNGRVRQCRGICGRLFRDRRKPAQPGGRAGISSYFLIGAFTWAAARHPSPDGSASSRSNCPDACTRHCRGSRRHSCQRSRTRSSCLWQLRRARGVHRGRHPTR